MQVKITDISNFILNYLDTYSPSNDLKNNLISIIDGKSSVDDKLDIKDRVIAFSTCYVKKLYENEKAIVRDLK